MGKKEGVDEVSETDFFRAVTDKKVLDKLAATYPSPCRKHNVPLWVYIASDISIGIFIGTECR